MAGLVGAVEVEHAGDRLVEQLEVVADDEQRAAVAAQEAHQPLLGVDVEVVRRLVEAQHVAAGEQDAGQLDAPPLAAGQHADREVDAARDRCRARRRAPGPRCRRRSRRSCGTAPRRGCSGPRCARRAAPPWRCAASRCARARRRCRARTGCGTRPCGRRARRRCAGPAAGSRTPPLRTTRPAAGSVSPPSTRNRLVLPAPLRPTRPTLSRGMTVKSADSTTSRPPTSTESPWAWSIRSGCQAERADPTTFAAAIVTGQGAGVATGPPPPPDDGWVAGGAGGLVRADGRRRIGRRAGPAAPWWHGTAAWVGGVAAPAWWASQRRPSPNRCPRTGAARPNRSRSPSPSGNRVPELFPEPVPPVTEPIESSVNVERRQSPCRSVRRRTEGVGDHRRQRHPARRR